MRCDCYQQRKITECEPKNDAIEFEISRFEFDMNADLVVAGEGTMKVDVFPMKNGIKNTTVTQSQQSTNSNFGLNTMMQDKVCSLILLFRFREFYLCMNLLNSRI